MILTNNNGVIAWVDKASMCIALENTMHECAGVPYLHDYMGSGTFYQDDTDEPSLFVPDIVHMLKRKYPDDPDTVYLLVKAYFLIASTKEWGVEEYGKYWKKDLLKVANS